MNLNTSKPRRGGPVLRGTSLFAIVLVLITGNAFAAKPRCGDGNCSAKETPASCPADCSATEDVCGDGSCGATESWESCPSDCEAPPPATCNNDGVCNAGEDCLGCADCAGKVDGKPKTRYCCGADTCVENRCGALCGAPVPECGNEIVEYDEECDDGSAGSATCDLLCRSIAPVGLVPLNQFNIGDSIGEGEAANGTISAPNHQAVWSTGYDLADVVGSLNERFEAVDAAGYTENDANRDGAINHAVSGAVMADFAAQAQGVASAMAAVPPGTADMVTVLLGNNDVCADSMDAMTDPAAFELQYRAGLDVLSSSPFTQTLNLQVSGIPAIYWLWNAKRSDFMCRAFIWPFVPCENLLSSASNDCADAASVENPDVIYAGDGPNCQRRKEFHARIRDVYNPILRDVLAEYRVGGLLPNAEYVDIIDVRFDSQHVNDADCFHPSKEGHALMATEQWCRSKWGSDDPACSP